MSAAQPLCRAERNPLGAPIRLVGTNYAVGLDGSSHGRDTDAVIPAVREHELAVQGQFVAPQKIVPERVGPGLVQPVKPSFPLRGATPSHNPLRRNLHTHPRTGSQPGGRGFQSPTPLLLRPAQSGRSCQCVIRLTHRCTAKRREGVRARALKYGSAMRTTLIESIPSITGTCSTGHWCRSNLLLAQSKTHRYRPGTPRKTDTA